MKKVFLTLLFIAAGLSCWADEYYIVGDATPWGWVTGDARKPAQMTETGTAGVYEWTGFLKHSEGFFICNSLSGWSGYGSSVPKSEGAFAIEGVGEDECTETDNKWNPTSTDWQLFTITLNTNTTPCKVSWIADESFAADDDGFYNIGSAKDLYLFSVLVNANQSAKAKLTANIDYTAYPQGFIGTNSKRFAGTFDGQEHTVTLAIDNDLQGSGLFGVVNGATIKNLIIDGTITASKKWIGGIGGLAYGNNTVENIVVKTAIAFTGTGDATLGGLFGDMEAASTVKNCAFYGSFQSENGTNIRGLASWCSNNPQFINCIIAPVEIDAAGFDNDKLANGNFTTTNCYKVDPTDARLASGELCYLLNGDQSIIGWYQTLGSDNVPVPFSSRQQVYANGELKCDGTSAGGALVYSNSHESTIPPHTDAEMDGRCDVCNKLIPDYLTLDGDGFYEIKNGTDLSWFATWVKEEKQDAKAKLTADIDYTAYPQGFIGIDKAFSGIFDGQQHTINIALENDAKIRGLFAKVNGASIKNLIVDGSITSSYNNLGGLGGQADGTNAIDNVIVKTEIIFTPSSGDASIGGFFPYINSGTSTFTNCAFYGSVKAGEANGNAGLVSWSSGTCKAVNSLIAPEEVEASAFDDFARGGKDITNSYAVPGDDARLASGELAYLLGDGFGQEIGTATKPSPFSDVKVIYVGAEGYATLYDTTTGYMLKGDAKAYVATRDGDYLKLTEIENVPASTPVILKGSYFNKVAADLPAINVANELLGTNAATEADGTMYVLAQPEDEEVGFYLVQSGTTIPVGKAYFVYPDGDVKAFYFSDGNATAIREIEQFDKLPFDKTAVYNLAGQRVEKAQKGLYIVDGKKVVR